MRFFTTEGFAPKGGLGVYGNRIWVEKENREDCDYIYSDRYKQIQFELKSLSRWGGSDKEGENYEAWEFSWLKGEEDKFEKAKSFLLSLGYVEERFHPESWKRIRGF